MRPVSVALAEVPGTRNCNHQHIQSEGECIMVRNWPDFPYSLISNLHYVNKAKGDKEGGCKGPKPAVERNGTWVRGHLFNLPNFPAKNLPYVLHSYQEPSVIQQPPVQPAGIAGLCKPPQNPPAMSFSHGLKGIALEWTLRCVGDRLILCKVACDPDMGSLTHLGKSSNSRF